MPYYRLVEAVAGLARYDAGGEGREPDVTNAALTALEKGHGAFQAPFVQPCTPG